MFARLSLATGIVAFLALFDPVPAEAGDTRVFIGVPSVEIYSPPVSIQFGAPRYYAPYYYPLRYYYPGPAYYGPRYHHHHHHRYHPHRRYHRDYYYRDRGYRGRW